MLNSQYSFSQNDFYYGVGGGKSFINNVATIRVIPLADDCGLFQSGKSSGFYLEGTLGKNLITNFLDVDLRLNYESRPMYLSTETSSYLVYNVNSQDYEPLVQKHEFSADLQYVSVNLGALISPIPDVPLKFRVGFEVGEPLISAKYDNKQTITAPNGYLYPGDKRSRFVENGELQTQTSIAALGSISYHQRITSDFVLVPEVAYRYHLNSVTQNLQWYADLFRVGIGIHYNPEFIAPAPPEEPKDTTPPVFAAVPPPPPPPAPNNYVENIKAENLEITETIVTQTYPLLPYIFFDSASAVIKPQYNNDVNRVSFNENTLPKSTLGIYKSILDVIGSRLYKSPNSKLEIQGVTDGQELADRDDRLRLAQDRASTISQYLIKKWGIKPSQLIVKSKDVPSKQTSMSYIEGFEENRRVELNSNNPDILKPVYHSKFLEFQGSKEKLNIKIEKNENFRPSAWELYLFADNTPIFLQTGSGAVPENVEIELSQEMLDKLSKNSGKDLYAELKVAVVNTPTEKHIGRFKVATNKNKFEVGRLNLIVFDFDKADITPQNQQMLKDFLTIAISPKSTTKITGSTDRLGNEEHNVDLSNRRAEAVRDFILNLNPEFKFSDVKGIGSSKLNYDNATPEGRFYCRTVLIEVQTPIEGK